jgi:hypothetical protein
MAFAPAQLSLALDVPAAAVPSSDIEIGISALRCLQSR